MSKVSRFGPDLVIETKRGAAQRAAPLQKNSFPNALRAKDELNLLIHWLFYVELPNIWIPLR